MNKQPYLNLIVFLLLTVFPLAIAADEPLSRRGYFGVRLESTADNLVAVTQVFPNSTAFELGIQSGDILESVAGTDIKTIQDVTLAVGRHVGGDVIAVLASRNGKALNLKGTLKSFPEETFENSTMEYSYGRL